MTTPVTDSHYITFPEFVGDPPSVSGIPKGAALILTGLRSVFGPQLASYWRKQGLEVIMISIEQPAQSGILQDGTYVLAANDYEPKWLKAIKYGPLAHLSRLERLAYQSRARTKKIVGPYPYYSAIRYAAFNLGVVRLVNQLEPTFVFAQCLMRFGFAAGICQKRYPTLVMPYGQDIYRHSLSSFPHYRIAKWALSKVDMICPASASAVSQIVNEFGITKDKIRAISWGVNNDLFYPPNSQEKSDLRANYGVPIDALVIMNARRFARAWGSDTVRKAFLELAGRSDNYFFVLIGGAGSESVEEFAQLKKEIELNSLSDQFLIFENGVSLSTFSELLMLSDIFTSLMLGSDMRSSSILQGTATGTAPIVTDWAEYRYMEEMGFRAFFVPIGDVGTTVSAVEHYRHNPEHMAEVIASNLAYIAQHEDYEKQMNRLNEAINEVVEKRGFER